MYITNSLFCLLLDVLHSMEFHILLMFLILTNLLKLFITVAPTSVTLKGRGRETSLEVPEGEDVTLECLVEASKPVATVVWYKNDRRIAFGK